MESTKNWFAVAQRDLGFNDSVLALASNDLDGGSGFSSLLVGCGAGSLHLVVVSVRYKRKVLLFNVAFHSLIVSIARRTLSASDKCRSRVPGACSVWAYQPQQQQQL